MRVFGLAIALVVLGVGCSQDSSAPAAAPDATDAPGPAAVGAEVAVTGGVVRGTVAEDGGLKQYHGIPFAAPPVGDLRWAAPAPVVPWEGVREAVEAGPACVQTSGGDTGIYADDMGNMSEDCLTLNVWTEAAHEGEKRAVMFWIHGGALMNGTGSRYPGDLLASKGVVLVTINYRLGRFGFLAHPELTTEGGGVSGNQGLRDQIQALAWVRENIAKFGGDPDNITIFGESAGSLSVSLVQGSPLAKGMFHRAIGQSGGAFQPMHFRAQATSYAPSGEQVGLMFGDALGGDLAAMRSASADEVMTAFASNPMFSNYDALAIVDGEVIPKELHEIYAAGEQADVPVMIGSNEDEATPFIEFFQPLFGEGDAGYQAWRTVTIPEGGDAWSALYPGGDQAYDSWVNGFTDVLFTYPMTYWARAMGPRQSDAFLYLFDWHAPVQQQPKYGAFHAAELGYIFGNVELFGATPTEADYAFSELMSDIWVRFAKTGNPNGDGVPQWNAYGADESYMVLGPELAAGNHLRGDKMAVIEAAWAARRAAAAVGAGD